MKDAGVYLLQGIPSKIIITISGGAKEACLADLMLLHGLQYLKLIIFRHLINGLKPLLQTRKNLTSILINLLGDSHPKIHLFHFIHKPISLRSLFLFSVLPAYTPEFYLPDIENPAYGSRLHPFLFETR